MAVSSIIKDRVASRDLPGIRDALFMATMKDPGFAPGGAVAEALEFCFKNGISRTELFQPDDGREIVTGVTRDDLAKICASLRSNFSERKFAVAQRIGRALYPLETTHEAVPQQNHESRARSSKKVLAAIVVAAIAVALMMMIKSCKSPEALMSVETRVPFPTNLATNAVVNAPHGASIPEIEPEGQSTNLQKVIREECSTSAPLKPGN